MSAERIREEPAPPHGRAHGAAAPGPVLRRYAPADRDAALAIWREASRIAHPFIEGEGTGERLRNIYLPEAETWVAEEDGEVVGFIGLIGSEIGGLFVAPGRQGGGLGRRLVRHAADIKGALTLEVFERNAAARAFYARLGFVEAGRRDDPETGHVLVRMSRQEQDRSA
jgi:putative acetyltransferase